MGSGQAGLMPEEEFWRSLPRKRMAACALFTDDRGRVLLVDPVYKDTWDLPGGVVEAEESPHAACRREVAEEIGLDRRPGRVLALDWVPSRPDVPEGLVVVYHGGVLPAADIGAIKVADGELAGFAFVAAAEVGARVEPRVGRRITASLAAAAGETVASLEDGRPAA